MQNIKIYTSSKVSYHDFSDGECLQILSHIREVMSEKSKLYVIERTLHHTGKPHINDYGDLMMMMLLTGRERYAHEWLMLFLQAGFEWINEAEPIEAEDHTIMVCQPKQAEISKSIGFFKGAPQERANNYQQRVQHLMNKNTKIPFSLIKEVCVIRKVIHATTFNVEHDNYSLEYINLLNKAINSDTETFMLLPVIHHNQLLNFDVDLDKLEKDYYFLPIQDENSYSGLLIDRWRKIIFYLNLTGQPLQEIKIIPLCCKKLGNDLRIIPLLTDNEEIQIDSKHTGLYLIALIANLIQKLHFNYWPSDNEKDLHEWLISAANLIGYKNNSIELLSKQQLRWAVDYLSEEINQEANMPNLVYRKPPEPHWGDLAIIDKKSHYEWTQRDFMRHTFSFFDTRTLQTAGCVNRGFYEIQLETELQQSFSGEI